MTLLDRRDARQTHSIGAIGAIAAVSLLAFALMACDPGYTVAVENRSSETVFLRITDGSAIYVFEVLAGARGYGPNELGAATRGVEILDDACERVWANDLSTGTFVLNVGTDLTVESAEGSVESFGVRFRSTDDCGANSIYWPGVESSNP